MKGQKFIPAILLPEMARIKCCSSSQRESAYFALRTFPERNSVNALGVGMRCQLAPIEALSPVSA
ncbi:hypothetical protein ACWDKQ_35890 [Saccharopolyspora sp. NPDC000995]